MSNFTSIKRYLFHKFLKSFLLVLFLIIGLSMNGQTTFDWLNTAPDGNFRQGAFGARWNPGGLFDEPGFGTIQFNNNNQTSMTNNVPGTWSQHKINFGSSATTSRTIGGNSIQFFDFSGTWPFIRNESTATHTINFPILVGNSGGFHLELVANAGNLVVGGTINNQGKNVLIYGNNTAVNTINRAISLSSVVSGAGKLIVSQFGVAKLDAIHTYAGNTEIDNGELWIETTGDAVANNNIFLGSVGQQGNTSKIFLSRAAGGTTFSRNININAGNVNTRFLGGLNTSGTNKFSGNIVRSSTQPLNIEVVNPAATVAFSGVINGTGNITKVGPGTVQLLTNNSMMTGTWLVENGTILTDNFPARMNDRPITLGSASTSGTLRFSSTSSVTTILQFNVNAGGGAIYNASPTNFAINTDTGGFIPNGSLTVGAESSGNLTFALRPISGSQSVTYNSTGTGKVVLAVAMTYTGATRISSGTMETNNSNRIANTSNIIMNGGTYSTGSSIGYGDTVGTLQLLENSTIRLGTGNLALTFAASNGVSWTSGKTLTITGWTGVQGATGTAMKIFIGNATTNLTSTQLGQINFTGFSNGAQLLSTGELVPAAVPIITITSLSALPNNGTATNAYNGSTITVTGTNFTGATGATTSIGGAVSNFTVVNATTITFTLPTASSGTVTVTSPNGTSSASASSITNVGFITNAATDWNTASTWLGGAVPTASSAVTIRHNITLNAAATNTNFNTIIINASSGITFGAAGAVTVNTTLTNGGSIIMTAGGTLTMGAAATLANGANTFTGGLGTVSFAGIGTVTGTIVFNNLTLNGAATLSAATTINGSLTLNSGASVATNAPIYGSASTLVYNTTGNYGINNEWTGNSTTAGTGAPNNVLIQNNTTITFPNSNRGCAGNFSIISGGATLNATSGDLNIAGNFTNNGTFTHNNRAVFLNGGSAQTLNGTLNGSGATNCFPFLIVTKSGGGVTLNTPVNVTNTLTLTTGIVSTTTINILNITSTTTGAVSGGGPTSFINGPLRWNLPNSGSGDFRFQVGAGTTYLPFNINNPIGTLPVVTVQAFAANVNASPSVTAPLISISNSEHWLVSNTGTFTSGTISLARASIGAVNAIGSSTAAAGAYTSRGGLATSTLISNNTISATSTSASFGTSTYFVLGTATQISTVTLVAATPNNGTATNAYNGSTITVNGTNFESTGMTVGTASGSAINSYTFVSATQITFVLPTGNAGAVTVTNSAGAGAATGTLANVGFISTGSGGNWSATGSWLGGTLPILSTNLVTIASGSPITLNTSATVTALTINSTGIFNNGVAQTLTIANNGTLTNNGTFTAATGSVTFAGIGTVTGTISFNNVTIAGGVNFGPTSRIGAGGFLQINGNGFVNINSPSYNPTATLIYNNGSFDRRVEWSTGSGNGYPSNVQIGNGNTTVLDLSADEGTNVARECAGNLVVSSGSTFTLNNMTEALTVKGNYTNSGTTVLSTAGGGDLILEGDMDDNGIFTANTRAIFFRGGANQTISSTTNPLDIDVMRIGKTGGEVILGQNLLVDETNDPIQFSTAQSVLNLNGRNVTFGKANAVSTITMNASSRIKGSSLSTLTLLGTGAFGTMYFDQTTPGTTNALSSFINNRTATGSVTLANSLTVTTQLTIGSGASITNEILAIQGTVTDARETPATRTYTGTIEYNGGTNQTVIDGTYNNLSLLNAGTKTFAQATTVSGNLVVTAPTVVAPSLLTFSGASQSIAGLPYNNIAFAGSGTKTFTSIGTVSPTSEITFTETGTVNFGTNLVTLQSTNAGTARVGNASNWTLDGTVTAERHIPARRAWRLLTAPLRGSTGNSIFANWQNNGAAGDATTGFLLWHPQGTATPSASNNGFFLGAQANVRSYTNGAWSNVANSNTPLFTDTENNPFLVFVTGPHASTATLTGTAAATTARAAGNLVTGTVTKALNANQFTLIGNPYASPINPANLINSNSGAKLWLINPTLGSFGGYVTFDGNWSILPDADTDGFIQSGQGFFVRTTASSFTINENHKVIGNSNNWFARNASDAAATESVDKVRVLLYKQEASNWIIADGILSVNQLSGNNDVDGKDAGKVSNFNESLMFRNNTSNISIEYRALPQTGEMQPLRMTGTTAIPYQLRIYTEDYTNSTLQPYLEDTTTGALTAIPMDGSEITVPFAGIVSNSTTPDLRFRIVYQIPLRMNTANLANIKVFPNPVVNSQLNINLGSDTTDAQYTITNLLGQSIQKGTLPNTQNTITILSVPKGIYILNISQADQSHTIKIYVQ